MFPTPLRNHSINLRASETEESSKDDETDRFIQFLVCI